MEVKKSTIALCVAIASLLLAAYNQWYIQHLPTSNDLAIEANRFFDEEKYKNAIKSYEKALGMYESDANTWRNIGFALFNLGIVDINLRIDRSKAYSSARGIIRYYRDRHPLVNGTNQDYFERASQHFDRALHYNAEDLEALLYKGIVSLFLSTCPSHHPDKEFDKTIASIHKLDPNEQEIPPVREIEQCAWYGKGVVCEKIGVKEKAKEYFQKANELK
jgi:tetratricopeptide (TPR) repeat protein